jgi:N-acyl-D-aspartate/D-glutamate deacylase
LDLYIIGGMVVDGTGAPAYRADIGIQKERIARINRIPAQPIDIDCPIIDVSGLVVAPGFIDAHSHSDFVFFQEPRPDMKLRQGVTTEICGNCGMSAAPVSSQNLPYLQPYVKETMDAVGNFTNIAEYRNKVEEHGLINNQLILAGHSVLRTQYMGMQARQANTGEIAGMRRTLDEALEQGAAGLSSGLFYPPMCYSATDELVELCKVVAKHSKIFTCHMRNYSAMVFQAVEEMFTIARKAGVAVQISHLMAAGTDNWGNSGRLLESIDLGRSRGFDLTFDQYPYKAALPGLLALLPPWMHEGGIHRTVERLQDRDLCDRAREDISKGLPGWENVSEQAGWENLVVMSPKIGEHNNQTIHTIAEAEHTDPASVVFSLLVTDPYCNLVAHWVSEEDLIAFMQHPAQMWGSDSAEAGPLSHPRTYGTYPKILREYVFEKQILGLEKAVEKMTSIPSRRFGLGKRGVVAEGWAADLVVFDSQKVTATSTYEKPDSYPRGIPYVIINGKIAVREGNTNPRNFGKML